MITARRALLRSALPVGAALRAGPARAQDAAYPARPVRVLVPFAPGGGVDVVGRIMAAELARALGQPFVVENRPGGGGLIALRQLAASPPDGYTLAIGAPGPLTIAPSLFAASLFAAGGAFDPLAALAPVIFFATTPGILIGRPDLPADDLAGLIGLSRAAMARDRPLAMASAGTGSVLHLIGEFLADRFGVRWTHVPYRGSGPAFADLANGTVDLMVDVVPTAAPLIDGGRAKGLCVTMPARSPQLPAVPTTAELGWGVLDLGSWMALLGPAGLPGAVVAVLNGALNAALAEPALRERLRLSGAVPGGGAPGVVTERLRAELPLWAEIIRQKQIRPE